MAADLSKFSNKMTRDGWVKFERALGSEHADKMRADCLKWITICTGLQVANGINVAGDGTGHHTLGGADSIDAFIDMHLFHDYLSHFFDNKPYILHACNPVGGFPNTSTYLHKVHRDTATYIPGFNMRLNMLVMLDEFTFSNGATRILSGSHTMADKPEDDRFNTKSESILGPRGTVVLFNSYLWHRGTENTTKENRVALTLSFGPAFIKPQLDYARMIGEEVGKSMSLLTRQVLGYNARVPASLEEWYKPSNERLYLCNQG